MESDWAYKIKYTANAAQRAIPYFNLTSNSSCNYMVT